MVPRPDQARYLTTVMRLKLGDGLAVFNGRDGEWRVVISDVGKRCCSLTCVAQARPQAPGPDLELIMALIKRPRLESVVEKAAELGAQRIALTQTQRSNADRARPERLAAIAAEAAEQTGRLDVPQIIEAQKLEKILAGFPGDRQLLFCDEGGNAQDIQAALQAAPPGLGWTILIGPEGGFAPNERTQLRRMPNVTPVTLGPRMLRADTAAIAAMSLWQANMGDWRGADPVASNRYSG